MTLRHAAFSGSRWTAASLLLRAVMQVAQTMVLARLLTPADFGAMAVVGAVYAIATLFVDLGISNALIHFPSPSRSTLSTLYWLNLAAAGVVALVFMALAWFLAGFYGKPELVPLMTAMGLVMPLAALGHQFCVMAEKELRFQTLAAIELAAGACGFVAAVLVAWRGGGVYAFIAGALTSALVGSALAWLLLSAGLRPQLHFHLHMVKPHLRYGSYRLGDALLNSVQSQADILLGAAAVGPAAMGVYTAPRNLCLQIAHAVINPAVTRVGLPVMAKLQGDRAALAAVYLQILRMTASLNFPIYGAVAVWASEIVDILFGPGWHQAVDFLRLFALWGLVRSTGNPVGSLLYSTGRVRAAFGWNLALLAAIPGLLWLGLTLEGALGLALAMVGVQALIFYPLFHWLVRPVCGLRFVDYAAALLPALVASAVAALAGFWVCSLVSQDPVTRILVAAPPFVLAYVGASYVINRTWLTAMAEFLRPMLRRSV